MENKKNIKEMDTNKTVVNISKKDLGDTAVTSNLDNLGDDVSVNIVEEEITPNKIITDKQLSRLAQQAGNFGEDVKDALLNLIMVGDNIPLSMVVKVLANYDLTLKDLKGQDATFRPSAEFAHLFNSSLKEEDAVIEPRDTETIKYLSNVRDSNTGEISKPFTIGDKNYQMVRGITPSRKVVMGVLCHDDMDDEGNNLIHHVDQFEENIVKPFMQQESSMGDDIEIGEVVEPKMEPKPETDSLNLSDYKHYLVNQKTGKFRKFKNIHELAEAVMGEGEKYMTIKEFKKFFEGKVFGGNKGYRNLNEVLPSGGESEEELSVKAKKLMDLISKKIPINIIKTIKTPAAKREVIAAFAELIGVPRAGLTNLISGLKILSKVGVTQDNPQVNPTNSPEQVYETKVIKKILIKDLRNGKL
jgi:hypothetical protein